MTLNPNWFLNATGQFTPIGSGQIGISTTTTTGFLTFVTSTTTLNLAGASTATTLDVAFVSQGSSGTWLATAFISATDTAGASAVSFKLWDGVTIIGAGICRPPAISAFNTVSVTGVISNPVGNIKLSVNSNTTTYQIQAGLTGNTTYFPNTAITAIRIG